MTACVDNGRGMAAMMVVEQLRARLGSGTGKHLLVGLEMGGRAFSIVVLRRFPFHLVFLLLKH